MKCKKNVRRIEDICEELMELIDESRAHGEDDECELICCVVHDSVQKVRRALERWSPEATCNEASQHRLESAPPASRLVN